MKTRVFVLVALSALLLSGCGSSARTVGRQRASTPGIGVPSQTFRGVIVDGQPISLAISGVTDPARDSDGFETDSHGDAQNNDHFATVVLTVTNVGTSTITEGLIAIAAYDQHGDIYASATFDQNVVADMPDTLQCPLSGGAIDAIIGGDGGVDALSPGDSSTYCLGFILPEPDVVTRFAVSGADGGSGSVTWRLLDTFKG